MTAAILAIGDEIVSGTTPDTNSSHVAGTLREIGLDVIAFFSVPDDEQAIARAVKRALEDADVVVSTGGLGPTVDDLTTACIARVAGTPLQLHEPSLAAIEERFRSRGLELPPNNRKQALLPRGCDIIPNPTGTAPGFVCTVTVGGRRRFVAALPGVPHEMRHMLGETLVPWLQRKAGGRHFATRVFSTFGLSESRLDELLTGLKGMEEGRLAFRAAFPRIQARVTLAGHQPELLEQRLDRIESAIRERLGAHLYATGDVGLEQVIGELLSRQEATIAVAESCTGGLIGHRITDVPGSSAYFLLGIVSYSNSSKMDLLGVPRGTIETMGAVSLETAEAMANGVRRRAGATFGLATTGVAGPGGGSEEKPVGTVCISLTWEGGCWSHRFDLGIRSREWIKQMTAQLALDRVRRHLLLSATQAS